MTIKEIPKTERPREKLISKKVDNLSTSELLAILISSGTKEKNVVQISFELLNKIGKLSNLETITLEELVKIKGIGVAKATNILAAIELGKRIFLAKKEDNIKLDNADKIYEYSKYLFHGKKQEYFYCFYVDNKKRLIESKLLFVGTMNRSTVHPREIFKEAYKISASGIICVHNHPSGEVLPSTKDIEFTKDLIEIGLFQGIPILDHLIVSEHKYFSFGKNNVKVN